jgi:radical SAM superfamily enzyme YgiQ (UPF0313 family)
MAKIMLCRMNTQNPCPIEEPLGLLSIAAYFNKKSPDMELDILDACVAAKEPEDVVKEAFGRMYDFFCASVITPSAPNAFRAAQLIRRLRSSGRPIIVFGGPHATALPEECLGLGADICIIGEGEEALFRLVVWYEDGARPEKLKEIEGIAFRDKNGNIWKNDKHHYIDIAAVSPVPYNAVSKYRYQTDAHITKPGMARPIMFSRGCSNNCSFCCSAIMWKRTIRRTTPREAIEELERSLENGYECFHIYDDDFLASPEWVRNFAEEIFRRELNIRYTCLSSCKSFLRVDEDTLKLMKMSGMSLVEIGIESLMPRVLSVLRKRQNVSEILEVFSRANKLDVNIFPLLLIMAPEETLGGHLKQEGMMRKIIGCDESLFATLEGNVGIFLRHAGFYTPYPGTYAWVRKDQQGIIIDNDWSNWTTTKMCFVPKTLVLERPINLTNSIQNNVMDKVMEHVMRVPLGDVAAPDALEYMRQLANGDNTILDISKSLCDRFNGIEIRRALAFTVTSVLAGGIIGDFFVSRFDS